MDTMASRALIENEFREGIKLWLETRQNQALYSARSPCETIEELLVDLQLCENYPWENLYE